MRDSQKTRNQLLNELHEARRQLEVLAAAEVERKQVGDELSKAEEKFYKAFLSSPDMMIITSMKDGKYIEVNENFINNTGYSRAELIGHTVNEFNLWVDAEDMQKMTRLLHENGHFKNEEYRFRTKSGDIRNWLCSAEIININGDTCMLAVAVDVTESRQMEQALADEAIWRRILIEQSRDGIVILDQTGKVYEANRRFTEMLGYSPEEMSQLHVWDWDTQWTPEHLLDMIKTVDEAGDHFETYHQRKDGTIVDVEISTNGATFAGKKLIFCVCRDITERKHMEQALRLSEEKFSKAFRSSPDSIVITRLSDGVYMEVNDSFTRVFGFSREEVIGHSSGDINIWAQPGDRKNMVRRILENDRVRNEEYQFRTKSGEIRTVLFSADKMEYEGEHCILSVANDITDYKRMEAQASDAEKLREVERLRTELLANVSHELRTPLASIKGFATMLMDYDKRLKYSEKREYLETIDKNADRLVELIEQLLEMSRFGVGMMSISKKPASVITLCREIIAEAMVRAPAHKFVLALPARLPRMNMDEQRVRQVLDNLIDNAVKYSDTGTEITLIARKTGTEMLFAVTDRGSGISKNNLSHVFERAFHSSRGQKSGIPGAGLGLPICKALVEAHGGRIWIESEEGMGTKCFFTLPLKTESVLAIARKTGK